MADVLGLNGKVVIVTGGTKGVGRGIATRFLEAGAEVIVCGRNAPETPVAAADKHATFVAADVREVEQIAAVVDAAIRKHGRLDVLVNNAGGSPPADAATASPRFSVVSPGDRLTEEGSVLSFTLNASDPDSNAILYSMAAIATGATLNPSTGLFYWLPNNSQSRDLSVCFYRPVQCPFRL